ncbi:MAG: type III pantothenate kinase [Candidatus Nitrospinota bacterium M3_3B_026]
MTQKLLAVDVGNTNIVLGVFEGEKLLTNWRLDTKSERTEDELAVMVTQLMRLSKIDPASVSDAAVSCVVPPALPPILGFLRKTFGIDPVVVGPGVKTGISLKVEDPREVGADRIVNAVGALEKYAPPLILVDFGTAITIDAVSAESEYLGGAITPGIGLSLNALYHHAARLPEVEFKKPPSVIGKNTVAAMQSGAYYGFASLVDGIVERMKPRLAPEPKVIATGGQALLVSQISGTIQAVEENLTLEGLRVIHARNRR